MVCCEAEGVKIKMLEVLLLHLIATVGRGA
jgi:hypothetical protein